MSMLSDGSRMATDERDGVLRCDVPRRKAEEKVKHCLVDGWRGLCELSTTRFSRSPGNDSRLEYRYSNTGGMLLRGTGMGRVKRVQCLKRRRIQ